MWYGLANIPMWVRDRWADLYSMGSKSLIPILLFMDLLCTQYNNSHSLISICIPIPCWPRHPLLCMSRSAIPGWLDPVPQGNCFWPEWVWDLCSMRYLMTAQAYGPQHHYTPATKLGGVYWIHPVCLSVRLSVCLLTFCVRSVASTVLDGFFLDSAQMITILRGCVACYNFFRIWKFFGLDLEKINQQFSMDSFHI